MSSQSEHPPARSTGWEEGPSVQEKPRGSLPKVGDGDHAVIQGQGAQNISPGATGFQHLLPAASLA
jgi:hypothetical protein